MELQLPSLLTSGLDGISFQLGATAGLDPGEYYQVNKILSGPLKSNGRLGVDEKLLFLLGIEP